MTRVPTRECPVHCFLSSPAHATRSFRIDSLFSLLLLLLTLRRTPYQTANRPTASGQWPSRVHFHSSATAFRSILLGLARGLPHERTSDARKHICQCPAALVSGGQCLLLLPQALHWAEVPHRDTFAGPGDPVDYAARQLQW